MSQPIPIGPLHFQGHVALTWRSCNVPHDTRSLSSIVCVRPYEHNYVMPYVEWFYGGIYSLQTLQERKSYQDLGRNL